jgi:hypothetical protein
VSEDAQKMNDAIRKMSGRGGPAREQKQEDVPLEDLSNDDLSDKLDDVLLTVGAITEELRTRLAAVQEGE